MVAVGVIRSDVDLSTDLRLLKIAEGLDRWLDEHVPDVVAVERVFAQHNVGTVMGTAQAAGLAMVAAARRGVPVALHTPSEVKAAVTGSGRADKAQVTTMITRILDLSEAPRPADAAPGQTGINTENAHEETLSRAGSFPARTRPGVSATPPRRAPP